MQVESQKLAGKVITELHGKQMNIGKVKVFVSYKSYIAFKRSVKQILAEAGSKEADRDSTKSIDKEKFDQTLGFVSNPYINNSVSGLKAKLQNCSSGKKESKIRDFRKFSDQGVRTVKDKPDFYDNSEATTKTKIDQIIDGSEDLNQSKKPNSNQNLNKEHKSEINNCLKVSNLDIRTVSYNMLLNLFNCFGNVTKLMIRKNFDFAVIEFESDKEVQRAIKYTDCIRFCGRVLSVTTYIDHDNLDSSSCMNNKELLLYTNESHDNRFNSNLSATFTPPSRILRFSGLTDPVSRIKLKDTINRIHKPVKVITDFDAKLNCSYFLVEFSFLYESYKVLSILHNTMIDGQKLFIEFYRDG